MLGQFVTDHPLLGVEATLRAQSTHQISDLEDLGDGDLVTIGGIIGTLARKYSRSAASRTRSSGWRASPGGVEVMAFPSVYEAVPRPHRDGRIVLVTGRIDLRGRELQIRANDVREPALGRRAAPSAPEVLVVDLPASGVHARRSWRS